MIHGQSAYFLGYTACFLRIAIIIKLNGKCQTITVESDLGMAQWFTLYDCLLSFVHMWLVSTSMNSTSTILVNTRDHNEIPAKISMLRVVQYNILRCLAMTHHLYGWQSFCEWVRRLPPAGLESSCQIEYYWILGKWYHRRKCKNINHHLYSAKNYARSNNGTYLSYYLSMKFVSVHIVLYAGDNNVEISVEVCYTIFSAHIWL